MTPAVSVPVTSTFHSAAPAAVLKVSKLPAGAASVARVTARAVSPLAAWVTAGLVRAGPPASTTAPVPVLLTTPMTGLGPPVLPSGEVAPTESTELPAPGPTQTPPTNL